MEPLPQEEPLHAVQDIPNDTTKKKRKRRKPKKKAKKEAEIPSAREARAVPGIAEGTESSPPAQLQAEPNNGAQSSDEEGILGLETNMAATRLSGPPTTTQPLSAEGGQTAMSAESGEFQRPGSEKVWQESEVAANTSSAAKISEHNTGRISPVKTISPIPVSTQADLPLKPALHLPSKPPQTLPPRPANLPKKLSTMASAVEGEGEKSKLPDKKGDDNKTVNDPKGSSGAKEPAPPKPEQGKASEAEAIAEFKFDGFDPRLRCPLPDCRKMTSCWDHLVVICPACGPKSYTRYCTKEHLYEDIQRHWVFECNKNKITGPVDQDTIRPHQALKRPYIINGMYNLIERHRQAVYRSMEDADYFIFDDVETLDPEIAEPTEQEWNSVRGTGVVVAQVVFPDEGSRSEKQMFDGYMQRILAEGAPLHYNTCLKALQMLQIALIKSGDWTEDNLTYLCMQVYGEWGNFKIPHSFYDVVQVNQLYNSLRILPPMPL